jgi:hypothetical protein
MVGEEGLFARALRAIGSNIDILQVQTEFAGLCNTIIIADRLRIRGRRDLKAAVDKASGYLTLGLERLTQQGISDPVVRAAGVLRTYALDRIFRVGFGIALDVKWQADKWYKESWFSRQNLPVSFWDEIWTGVLGGLLLKRPQFFDNYATGVIYREFSSMADIQETQTILDQIIAVDRLLSRLSFPELQRETALTYKNLLLTAWAAGYIDSGSGGDMLRIDLLANEIRRFHNELFPGPKPTEVATFRRIPDHFKSGFLDWLSEAMGGPSEDLNTVLLPVFENLFEELESEYGAVDSGDLDPRYIGLFRVRSGGAG